MDGGVRWQTCDLGFATSGFVARTGVRVHFTIGLARGVLLRRQPVLDGLPSTERRGTPGPRASADPADQAICGATELRIGGLRGGSTERSRGAAGGVWSHHIVD